MRHLVLLLTLFFTTPISSQVILKDIYPGPLNGIKFSPVFDVYKDQLYFDGDNGNFESKLWKSDGTPAGTVRFDHESSSSIDDILILDSGTLYSRWKTLYFTNGIPNDETEIFGLEIGSIRYLSRINDTTAIFIGDFSDSIKIYRTNGKADGTLEIGAFPIALSLEFQTRYYDFFVFAESSTQSNKFEPFMTDGTPEGTMTVNEYLSDLGVEDDIESAIGVYDVLLAEKRGNDYAVFNDSVFNIDIVGNLRKSTTVQNKRYLRTSFNFYSFNVDDKTITQLPYETDFFSGLTGNDSSLFYVDSDDRFVYRHDPITETSTKLSTESIGFTNFRGFLKVIDDNLFYWVKGSSGNLLKAIDLNTSEDQLVDTASITTGLVLVPQVFKLGDQVIYSKLTNAQGHEWWINQDNSVSIRIPQQAELELIAYPNPTTQNITIRFEKQVTGILALFDIFGKEITKRNINNSSLETIDLSQLAEGNYIGSIKQAKTKTQFFKVIKY